jgi:hypothetical protein
MMHTNRTSAWLIRAGILALALPVSACFGTEMEVVTEADSVTLMGSSFVHEDQGARDQTTYTWDETRRAYVDPDRTFMVRFGRLRGEVYLAQMENLGDLTSSVPGIDPKLLAGKKVYMVGLIRVSPPRVQLQFPQCLGMRDSTPQLARSLGVEFEDSRVVGRLRGSRAGIIGFFLAGLGCDPGAVDGSMMRILPQQLAPGGAEMAVSAAKPGTGVNQMAAALQKQCLGGGAEACHKLGQMYARGDGVAADPAQAAKLFERLCTAGRMEPCLDLAMLLDAGNGVARDTTRATALIKQACSGGEPYACELLKTRR